MKHKIVSSGGIFYSVESERFLFLLRNSSKYNNTWDFAGGRVEDNETPYEGLLREIEEEIGFAPNIIKTVPIELFTSENKKFTYHTYILLVDSEFIPSLNREHCGYAWVTLNGWPAPLHPGVFSTLKLDLIKQKIQTIIDVT